MSNGEKQREWLRNEILSELRKIEIFPTQQRKNIDKEKSVEGFCMGRTWDLNWRNNPNCDAEGWCDSKRNTKFPTLFLFLKELARTEGISEDEWKSIQINKNVICDPHVDGKNTGKNFIITLGDFLGGETIIDGIPVNSHNVFRTFNPHDIHYNEEHEGERYSITFFTPMGASQYEDAVYFKYKIDECEEDLYNLLFHREELRKNITPSEHTFLNMDTEEGAFECWCEKYGAKLCGYYSTGEMFKTYQRNIYRHRMNFLKDYNQWIHVENQQEKFNSIHARTYESLKTAEKFQKELIVFTTKDFSVEKLPSWLRKNYEMKTTNTRKNCWKHVIFIKKQPKLPPIEDLTLNNNNDPVIVVKSKDRLLEFEEKTYNKIIKKYGWKDEEVFVFVSDEKDWIEYSEKFPKMNIILGDKGIVGIDNFIVNYFDEGKKYIYMNDDVSGVYEVVDEKTKKPVEDLKGLMNEIFELMEKMNYSMGGLAPVLNPYFMESYPNKVNFGLCLIMDPVSCCINNKEVILTEVPIKMEDGSTFIGNKTDHEKCVLHFKSKGGLVRFNKFAADVKCYNKKGGYRGRNKLTEYKSAEFIKEKYPEFISSVIYKKGGKTSLKLRRKQPFIPSSQSPV